MKVLLYFEGSHMISKSNIGRARKHQREALKCKGIECTCNPTDIFDILHINTIGPRSLPLIGKQLH